jgi:hydroxyacylglutathione hydrolase
VAADVEENRRSSRRLAALEPKLMLFGHGGPLRDTRKFVTSSPRCRPVTG